MAQHSAAKRTVVAGNTSEITKRGRPFGSKNRPPEERIKQFDYTRTRLTLNNPVDFVRYLAGYPDKTGLKGYWYRLKPKIDMSLIGTDSSNIKITHDPLEMTEGWIGKTFGRGHYQLKLNDQNRIGQTEVCRVKFEIEDPEYPAPVYDPRSLCLGDPANQDEIQRQLQAGVYVRDPSGSVRLRTASDGVPAAFVPPAQQSQENGIVGNAFVAEMFRTLMNRGSADPSESVRNTIEMARLLNDRPAAPALDVESIIERVALRLGGPKPEDSIFTAYEKVQTFFDRFGPKPVVGEVLTDAVTKKVGGSAVWAASLPAIIAEGRSLIPGILQMMRELRGAKPEPQNQNGVEMEQRQQTLSERIEVVARAGLQKMREGVQGFDYAAWVCNFHPGGLEVYRTLEGMGGAVGLMAMLAMNPATVQMTSDPEQRAQIEKFLNDFFSYDTAGDTGAGAAVAAGA